MPRDPNIEYLIKLLRKNKKVMLKKAFGILHNKADAEDAVQEAYIKIANNAERVLSIPQNKMIFYFLAAAGNASKDILKKKHPLSAGDIEEFYDLSSDYLVEEAVEKQLLIEEVRSAIKELSDRDQTLMNLRFFEEYSPKEIAAIMNIPETNIYKYIERARQRLVKILNERGIYYDP